MLLTRFSRGHGRWSGQARGHFDLVADGINPQGKLPVRIRFTPFVEITVIAAQLLIPATITYALTTTLVKVSILLLYRRIFIITSVRRTALILGAVSVAWGIATILGQILLCRPISAAWDSELLFTEKCIDVQAYLRAVAISNVLIDLMILCLPIHRVIKLQFPARKKIVVCGIFMLGGLSVHSLTIQ